MAKNFNRFSEGEYFLHYRVVQSPVERFHCNTDPYRIGESKDDLAQYPRIPLW